MQHRHLIGGSLCILDVMLQANVTGK